MNLMSKRLYIIELFKDILVKDLEYCKVDDRYYSPEDNFTMTNEDSFVPSPKETFTFGKTCSDKDVIIKYTDIYELYAEATCIREFIDKIEDYLFKLKENFKE